MTKVHTLHELGVLKKHERLCADRECGGDVGAVVNGEDCRVT